MDFLKRFLVCTMVVVLCSASTPFLAFADAGADENEELKREIVGLKERLNALEARLEKSEAKVIKV